MIPTSLVWVQPCRSAGSSEVRGGAVPSLMPMVLCLISAPIHLTTHAAHVVGPCWLSHVEVRSGPEPGVEAQRSLCGQKDRLWESHWFHPPFQARGVLELCEHGQHQ